MGYTHYWRWMSPPDPKALRRACRDMAEIVKSAPRGLLAGGHGDGQPLLDALEVVFNGKGDASHETFAFPGDTVNRSKDPDRGAFNFTKTARKPYDLYVIACLLVARSFFVPETLYVSSDGAVADWEDGRDVVQKVLKFNAPLDFLREE